MEGVGIDSTTVLGDHRELLRYENWAPPFPVPGFRARPATLLLPAEAYGPLTTVDACWETLRPSGMYDLLRRTAEDYNVEFVVQPLDPRLRFLLEPLHDERVAYIERLHEEGFRNWFRYGAMLEALGFSCCAFDAMHPLLDAVMLHREPTGSPWRTADGGFYRMGPCLRVLRALAVVMETHPWTQNEFCSTQLCQVVRRHLRGWQRASRKA